jgi:GMP synthase (glutamine-hydrolysing)
MNENNFKLIELLRELFKDEMRLLGKGLGIVDNILWRQLFPWSRLSIVTSQKVEVVEQG